MSSQAHASNWPRATLHVFAENGVWHWGISIPRQRGGGFQVVAYNPTSFYAETDALTDGSLALQRLSHGGLDDSRAATQDGSFVSRNKRREYMRERLRCAMARLVRSDEAQAPQAAKWVKAWGALIGEQHFDRALRKRSRAGTAKS